MARTKIHFRRLTGGPYVLLSACGAKGDGVTDVTSKVQLFINSLPAYSDVLVDGRFYIPGGLTLPSNIAFHGTRNGALLGSSAYLTGSVPIPTTTIVANGSYSTTITPVAYTSPIAAGTTGFSVSNSFVNGQYVMVRNYPSDTTGANSDAFTRNSDGSRAYANVSSANRRQYRRIEPARVRLASSGTIELFSGVAYDYRYVDQLQFAPYTPVENILFDDVYVKDIYIQGYLTDRMKWQGGMLRRSSFVCSRSMGCSAEWFELDAEDTDNCISFSQATIDWRINGKARGGNIPSDNALVRVDQSAFGTIDVQTSAHKAGVSGILCDTNYAECPGDTSGTSGIAGDLTGRAYTDVPLRNITITLNDHGRSDSTAIFVACDPFCDASGTSRTDPMVDTLQMNITTNSINGQAVHLVGAHDILASVLCPLGTLRVEGCTGSIYGKWGAIFEAGGPGVGTVSDARSSATYVNALGGLSFAA